MPVVLEEEAVIRCPSCDGAMIEIFGSHVKCPCGYQRKFWMIGVVDGNKLVFDNAAQAEFNLHERRRETAERILKRLEG